METNADRRVGELEQAFIDSMDVLPSPVPEEYGGVVALGRAYSANIDEARMTDTETATKSLYLGPHLLGVMKLLGMAPVQAPEATGDVAKGGRTETNVIEIMRRMKRETSDEAKGHGA